MLFAIAIFRMRQNTITVICILLLLYLPAGKVHAYLDPGSVSLALQAIAAAVAGAMLMGKYWFWQVLGWFGIQRKYDSEHSPSNPVDE